MKTASAIVLAVIMFAGVSSAYAEDTPREFQQVFSIGGRISAAAIIVGWPRDEANIKKLVDIAAGHANEALLTIDADIRRINEASPRTAVAIGWQTAEYLSKAQEVARWTDTDILAAAPSRNAAKALSLDAKARTATRTSPDVAVAGSAIIEGYLADLMIRYINAGGMNNALVRVGNVFHGLGQSLHGPWKIQVQEDSTAYAKHSLNLTVSNIGIATVSATQLPGNTIYDPRSGEMIRAGCKGATVAMPEAAHAQGIAHAVMIAGPDKGMKILNGVSSASGLIIDAKGTFLRKGL